MAAAGRAGAGGAGRAGGAGGAGGRTNGAGAAGRGGIGAAAGVRGGATGTVAAGATAGRCTTGVGAAGGGAGRTGGARGAGEGTMALGITGVGCVLSDSGRPALSPLNSSRCLAPSPSGWTVMTPPQTAQRARIDAAGTLAGSTRNTDRHSGQETFTGSGPPLRHAPALRRLPSRGRHPRCWTRCDDRWSKRIRAASWRSSSFQRRVRSLGPHA